MPIIFKWLQKCKRRRFIQVQHWTYKMGVWNVYNISNL